jgi:hypothetical protein
MPAMMCMWDFRDMHKAGQREAKAAMSRWQTTSLRTSRPGPTEACGRGGGSHGHGQQLSRPPSDWTPGAAVGYVKLLRKPEGSIWMGPSGICRAHFTSRDKTRAEMQRTVYWRGRRRPTAVCGNLSEPVCVSDMCEVRVAVGGKLETGNWAAEEEEKACCGKAWIAGCVVPVVYTYPPVGAC